MSFRTFCISKSEKDLEVRMKDSLVTTEIFLCYNHFQVSILWQRQRMFYRNSRLKMLKCILWVRSELHPISESCVWEIHCISQVFNWYKQEEIVFLFKFQFFGDFFKLQSEMAYCLDSCFSHVFENCICIHEQRKFITPKLNYGTSKVMSKDKVC